MPGFTDNEHLEYAAGDDAPPLGSEAIRELAESIDSSIGNAWQITYPSVHAGGDVQQLGTGGTALYRWRQHRMLVTGQLTLSLAAVTGVATWLDGVWAVALPTPAAPFPESSYGAYDNGRLIGIGVARYETLSASLPMLLLQSVSPEWAELWYADSSGVLAPADRNQPGTALGAGSSGSTPPTAKLLIGIEMAYEAELAWAPPVSPFALGTAELDSSTTALLGA